MQMLSWTVQTAISAERSLWASPTLRDVLRRARQLPRWRNLLTTAFLFECSSPQSMPNFGCRPRR